MNKELELLETVLKRHSEDPDLVDIEDEVDHYFFFDVIQDPDDFELAWSVFTEQEEIRRRLALIENDADSGKRLGP